MIIKKIAMILFFGLFFALDAYSMYQEQGQYTPEKNRSISHFGTGQGNITPEKEKSATGTTKSKSPVRRILFRAGEEEMADADGWVTGSTEELNRSLSLLLPKAEETLSERESDACKTEVGSKVVSIGNFSCQSAMDEAMKAIESLPPGLEYLTVSGYPTSEDAVVNLSLKEIPSMPSLVYLNLTDVQLPSSFFASPPPPSIVSLTLKEIIFSEKHRGDFRDWVSALKNLEVITIGENAMDLSMLAGIHSLEKLRGLSFLGATLSSPEDMLFLPSGAKLTVECVTLKAIPTLSPKFFIELLGHMPELKSLNMDEIYCFESEEESDLFFKLLEVVRVTSPKARVILSGTLEGLVDIADLEIQYK